MPPQTVFPLPLPPGPGALGRRLGALLCLGLLCLLCLCLLGACASGRQQAAQLAAAGGFRPMRFETRPFVLLGWLKPGQGKVLYVYIEGDGRAWLRPNQPSSDPTPANPVGLRLALADPAQGPVLYLARPCQYTEGADRRGCTVDDWTSARFSERALAALDDAVTQAMARTRADAVALHGYSGGGGMAALLAARRGDVVFLATVAGNLDHKVWTAHHKDSPLTGSLNPVDTAAATRNIPQLHVIGGQDNVVIQTVLDSWCARLPGALVQRVSIPDAAHGGPWETRWADLLKRHRGL
ncbi:MAG: hypothetical protein KKA55_08320 [Proteobacteria bacterium]|nr:hypothetical protein [Pseudomonadota bacterium]MBU1595521.1 hypothetical protein [Pseudomonadota bacterium]